MKLETPEQHELRTMPEIFHQSKGRGSGESWSYLRTKKEWHAEENRKHSILMDTNPEYRRQCIEREDQLKEWQKGNELI